MNREQIETLKTIHRELDKQTVINWANETDLDYHTWTDIQLYIAYGLEHLETPDGLDPGEGEVLETSFKGYHAMVRKIYDDQTLCDKCRKRLSIEDIDNAADSDIEDFITNGFGDSDAWCIACVEGNND